MKISLSCVLLIGFALTLAACSTTEHLPEGEQLYTGIKRIHYETPRTPIKKKTAKAVTDSTGVITAIADAVETIDQAIKGEKRPALSLAELQARDPKTLTKAERRYLHTQEKAERRTMTQAKTEVDAVLAYAPNGALFGSSSITSPWKFGLWTYNRYVNSHTIFGRWMFRTFAEAPVLISNVAPQTRTKVANNTLHSFGYLNSTVNYEVLSQRNPKKAKIAYTLRPGQLFYLDSIEYRGFDSTADSLLRATRAERLLRRGDAFNTRNLAGEQARIETLMRNNGYYYYTAGITTFAADTTAHPGFVQLRVQPNPNRKAGTRRPWYIGRTYINIRNLDNDPLEGTMVHHDLSFAYPGKRFPIYPSLWRRAIAHFQGDRYSLADQKATFERLYAMGIFSSMDIDYVPSDTSATCDTLNLHINAVLARSYDSSFEMNATLKSNQQVGPGVSYELSKLNAFRAGETISGKLFGSYEWQLGNGRNGGNSLLNSFELGTKFNLKYPRLLLPWDTSRWRERQRQKWRREYEKARALNPTIQPFRFGNTHPIVGSTTFSLNADWRNRSGFFQIISTGADVVYKWSRHPQLQHELSVFSIEYNRLVNTTFAFDSITNANPALYVSMRNQFVPSVGYTLTYRSPAADPHPLLVQASVKEAGNLLAGVYALAGRPWSEADKHLLGSPFAQFVKATLEARYTRRLSPRFQLATRFFAGAVYSYGNSSRAPYGEQFYVGGANSVRAFSARTVGPGGYYAPRSRYSYIDQTGDLKLEANAELRARLFGSLHGAVFLDAGNVWLMKPDPMRPDGEISLSNLKRVAVGTGAGLRYDLQYLVVRFDVGVGLHTPYDTSKDGFFNILYGKDRFAFHFAIGYPF